MNIKEKIKEKTKQLEGVGREIAQLQGALQKKQVEAIKLDGAISQLKELETESK